VTQEELQAIAEYMFEYFNMKNLTEAQAIENRLNKMPKGQRLAIKYNCLGCHRVDKDLVGPAFIKIAKRYDGDIATIEKSIKKGSTKKWKGFRGAMMPKFATKLSDEDIKILSQWILKG